MKKVFLIVTMVIGLILSACASTSSSTPIPTIVFDSNSSTNNPPPKTSSGKGITASAVIVPARQANLAFIAGGNVQAVNISVGDQVKTGQVLMEVDNTIVQLEVEGAKRAIRELTSPAAIASAEESVANSQKAYDDARKKVDSIKSRKTDNVTINYLKDQVTLSQDALDRARDAYKQTSGHSSVDPIRANAGTNLYNAQKAYNTALGNLNWYTQLPSENDIALTTADFDIASAALQEAKWYVSELKGEPIPADATGAQLTQLQQARDNLQAAQDRLDQTRLIAPFNGTITEVNIVASEYASPGRILIVVSEMDSLRAETTDLSERDIIKIYVGDSATVYIEALNENINGKVIAISPQANTVGGDVVFKVTIALDEQPQGLLWGMTAEVHMTGK